MWWLILGLCGIAKAEELPKSEPIAYVLCVAYGVTGAPTVAMRAASASFARAERHAAAHRHAEAADGFLEAAVWLREPVPPALAQGVRHNRRIAYANATLSWINADRLDASRRALEKAAAEDLPLKNWLRATAAALPALPRCGR